MQIKCGSFLEMSEDIRRQNAAIVMVGAGATGTITTPSVLSRYGLLNRVSCYLDNDSRKWGTQIGLATGNVFVYPVHDLDKQEGNLVLLLNVTRYADVLRQLEGLRRAREAACYIMPMMCIHNFCREGKEGVLKTSSRPLIPKKIHYMWLGNKVMPPKLQMCLDSWKRFCPDYEIIRWDERNYDIEKNVYMKQAYEAKAYGFVPDYARLDILYHHGGIYMDTDVEIIKSLDGLLFQEAFCGVEKWQLVNFGGCSGAVKGHKAILAFLNGRKHVQFLEKDGSRNQNTCGYYDTAAALDHGYRIDGKNQNILGMNIYSYDYFHPYDYMSGKTDRTGNTFTIHHFNGGWLDEGMREANRNSTEAYERIYRQALKGGRDPCNHKK